MTLALCSTAHSGSKLRKARDHYSFKMHCDHHFRSFSSTPKIKTPSSCPFSVQVLLTETRQTKSTPASTSWESYTHLHSLLVELIPIFPGYTATITLAQGVHALPELSRTEEKVKSLLCHCPFISVHT